MTDAGIDYSFNAILGCGGAELWRENADATAALINAVQLHLLFIGTLHAQPGCKLYVDMKKGIFKECTYGTKYCKNSPTVDEKPLQEAILNAINSVMSSKKELVEQISDAMKMELIPIAGETASVGDIDRLIVEQEQKFQEMFEEVRNNQDFMKRAEEFKAINAELARLKARRTNLLEAQQRNSALSWRIDEAIDLLNTGASALAEWDESVVRQLVEEVRVVSKEKIIVTLSGGIKVEQTMEL